MTKPRTLLTASCPMCNRFKKNEKLIFQILKDNHINFKYDYHINKIVKDDSKFRIDFLINNTIIEYNGKQHYQPSIFNKETKEQSVLNFQKQVKRDEYIKEFCNKNNIELIVIDGRKFFNKRLINYIETVILPILKNCF